MHELPADAAGFALAITRDAMADALGTAELLDVDVDQLAGMLARAIGVIYRPETELASHYFQAVPPRQFDSYIWFDGSRAVTPFETEELAGLPDTYPFGL